jgi:6-O-methylguanine DNA methyltransferase, DNA binding domain
MSPMICEGRSHLAVYTRGNPCQSSVDIISYATSECALGRVLVARTADVCAILIGTADELEADLAARFRKVRLVKDEAIVLDDKLRAIPFGRTVTYRELARWVGPLTSARAVASACTAVPVALAGRTGRSHWPVALADRTGRSLPLRCMQQWRSGGLSLVCRAQA